MIFSLGGVQIFPSDRTLHLKFTVAYSDKSLCDPSCDPAHVVGFSVILGADGIFYGLPISEGIKEADLESMCAIRRCRILSHI